MIQGEPMTDNRVSIRAIITGRVQGVFFRLETQNAALEKGLAGWVRNLPDGSVETLLCGPSERVEDMLKWLQQGPALARVDEVNQTAVAVEEPAGFEILP